MGEGQSAEYLCFTGMVATEDPDSLYDLPYYRFRVFVATADGANLRRIDIEDEGEAGYPQWDLDGQSLTYLIWKTEMNPVYTPYRMWLDQVPSERSPAPERLQSVLPLELGYGASAWSSNGNLFAAVREGRDVYFGFDLVSLDGVVHERCAQSYRYAGTPTWSPDGTAIAFTAATDEEGTTSNLYVLERTDGEVRDLGAINYYDIFAWCPDSMRLCVVTESDDALNPLHIVARDGKERQHLLNLNLGDVSGEMAPAWPAWSPDGQILAVSTIPEEQENSEIYFYTAGGEFIRRIAWPEAALVRIDDLAWQPRSDLMG